MGQLAVVAHGHDEVHAVDANAFPFALLGTFADPTPWNIRPDLVFNPGLRLVANPARLAREYQRGFVFQREQHVNISMHDLEPRRIEHGAFKTGVLIAANDERVDSRRSHARSNVLVAALDFVLARQL